MRAYPLIPCPHCAQRFQPRRKNQHYCSTECRTDANNARAKQRYTTFKEEAPKLGTLAAQVRSLKAKLASAILLIKDVDETSVYTIRYAGRDYKRGERLGRLPGVTLSPGFGLLTGDTIAYRTKTDYTDSVYKYTPEA